MFRGKNDIPCSVKRSMSFKIKKKHATTILESNQYTQSAEFMRFVQVINYLF